MTETQTQKVQQETNQNLIWIDLEMTGLDPDSDTIIEIATIVTDAELNVLSEGPVFAIAHPSETLAKMDDWNTKTHTESGLVARIRNDSVPMREAEEKTIAFLKPFVPAGVSPMCGNTVCQDRRFLARWMPELKDHFHYRHIDVSTLKELANRWRPGLVDQFEKQEAHTALLDIRESIEELKFYRKHFLNG